MSLVVCSSAQDKYQSVGSQVTQDGQLKPSRLLAPGMQNPAQFTNNINPVMVIPANSEVALKDISFYKASNFKVGINVSMSVWVGELLRSRWRDEVVRGINDVTSVPIMIPLQPGEYNSSTFANMLENMLNQYISYPDLKGNISVVPWSSVNDGTYEKGYIFDFKKGATTGVPADRSADMDTMYALPSVKNQFTWTAGTKTYLSTAGNFGSNIGVLTDMPISLNGGEMTWDVTNCTGGWRISFTRPITPKKPNPKNFKSAGGDLPSDAGYSDITLEYATRTDGAYADTENTFRIFNSIYRTVEGAKRFIHREVKYYNNQDAHFTPLLTAPDDGLSHQFMHQGSAATFTDLTANPTSVTIKMFGEDTYVELTANAIQEVMTDSRLCIAANANLVARTPTRNQFIKPVGTTSHVLYPKISLYTNAEHAVLTTYSGIPVDTYEYPLDGTVNPAGAGAGPPFPVSTTGTYTSGSSFYGRSKDGLTALSIQAMVCDQARPYRSSLTSNQKQYVGLDGPVGGLPPTRVNEGTPYLPAITVGDGAVAYSIGLITIPSKEELPTWSEPSVKGVYICETSDVSELLGFSNTSFVGQSIVGSQYLYADRPVISSSAIPTNTPGSLYGWYIGSSSVPKYEVGGSVFVRCPTLTHQSYNFGKGIPSKIIATIPAESLDGGDNGEGFYSPSEMTYLTLNNTEALHFNDITIELVDKNEHIIDIFERNTTAVLHFRKAK